MELSELDLISEASTVLKEVSFGVKEASLSQQLPCTPDAVYINIMSLEGDRYCIHLDMCGYEIIAYEFDCVVEEVRKEKKIFETLASLLDAVSPMYRLQFGMAISEKLKHLVDDDQRD